MTESTAPMSLRARAGFGAIASRKDHDATNAITAAFVIVAASGTAAEAQQAPAPLTPVTVDAPKARPQQAAAKPTKAQVKARNALRRKVRSPQPSLAAPVPGAPAGLPTSARVPGSNPYADAAAPYKADRLSSSKFTEPLLNTPRTVTVLTKEVLEDKNATTLREIGRSTAGVTLGSGEGGNAFGDRFFIRGFDARNDIFVDGVRDPGVSIRENFFTEQVEILRGPASSFAGRGTTGGAINIVTKKASDQDFNRIETELGSDQTKRVTIDVNKAINPILDVRLNGLFQDAGVAGRDFTTDNRNGVAGAVTFKPLPNFTIWADYAHSYLSGIPDFGVPYDAVTKRPLTEGIVPRNIYYGDINRDFTKSMQNIGTLNAEYKVNDWLTLENKFRQGFSTLNYVGTIPENPSSPAYANSNTTVYPFSFSGFVQLNAQSRYETVSVIADQPQATFKFNVGPIKNTAIVGGDFSREHIGIDSYTGLTSEITTGPVAFASSGAPISSAYSPSNFGFANPVLTNNPLRYRVNTNAAYLIDTANYEDKVIFNAGVRFDDYKVSAQNFSGYRVADDGIVSYNFGLVYKPIPITSLYAAYATAADPVGDELDATSSSYGGLSPTQPVTQIYGPQRSEAVEVGNKWELFDRHLLVTGALFQTTVTNARETAPANIPGVLSGSVIAGASYRIRGIDLEAAGKITDKWSVLSGFVIMNSDVLHSVNPYNDGLQLANIAHQSFTLLSKYEITPWFELGGQAVYTGKILGGSLLVANAEAYPNAPNPTQLPSHWRFDTFAEFKVGPYLTTKVYVQNVFNRTYYDSVYQSGQPFIAVAPGRAVYLVTTAKF